MSFLCHVVHTRMINYGNGPDTAVSKSIVVQGETRELLLTYLAEARYSEHAFNIENNQGGLTESDRFRMSPIYEIDDDLSPATDSDLEHTDAYRRLKQAIFDAGIREHRNQTQQAERRERSERAELSRLQKKYAESDSSGSGESR